MKRTWFLIATVLGNLAPDLTAHTTPSIEERLLALEKKVEALTQENSKLKAQIGTPQEESPAAVPVKPAGRVRSLLVGGYLQGQGEFGGTADSRWKGVRDRLFLRRARIYVSGTFAEDFDFKAELDLQGNTLGAGAGQLARANEVFVNWHKYTFANLRMGQLKPAFGAEHLMSATKLYTIERSLSTDRLADRRQLAVGASGHGWEGKISYLAIVANGNGPNASSNDNSKFSKSARIVFTPVSAAEQKVVLGVNGLWTTDAGVSKPDLGLPGDSFTGSRRMKGVDARWMHGRLDLSAEWLKGRFRPSQASPASRFSAEGWHGTIAYSLVPQTLQVVFRHEQFDPNTAEPGNSWSTNTFGLNYMIKGDDLKLSVNYLDGSTPESASDAQRVLTRVQVVF